jgi:hypothetical protein
LFGVRSGVNVRITKSCQIKPIVFNLVTCSPHGATPLRWNKTVTSAFAYVFGLTDSKFFKRNVSTIAATAIKGRKPVKLSPSNRDHGYDKEIKSCANLQPSF